MNSRDFYEQEKSKLTEVNNRLKLQLLRISWLRLFTFLATAFGIYMTYNDPFVLGFLSLTGFVIFIFLVVRHSDLIRRKKIEQKKLEINSIELSVLNKTFYTHDHGLDFMDGNHAYSHDIDLFGEYSFFFYLNRTVTAEGRTELAAQLISNDVSSIEEKQEAIKELSEKVKWRQHFAALASLVRVEHSAKVIQNYIANYQPQFSKTNQKIPFVFSIASLLIIGLTIFQILSLTALTVWFFLGLTVTGSFVKKTQKVYAESGSAKNIFAQYHPLLNEIENIDFAAKILKEQQEKIKNEEEKASKIFKDFSRILDTFDQRNNLLVAIFGNAFFLWDLRNACRVEKWIESYKEIVPEWFDVVSFFDAQNSLANFCFNNPTYQFPKVISARTGITRATSLGHPLLDDTKRVDNDFSIEQGKFIIVTGANMAGKSTFLRTVGLSLVMANLGLPVCATSFEFKPTRLITSMRTADSLAQNESYFYAELKRLKHIVELIKEEEYFIILDEILKGTNSKDKAVGSRKFVEKLVSLQSTGIIATHDISLCDLEKDYEEISNYFFEAEIKNEELFFDYILKEGVCKNMNASFLLNKMKII